MQDGIKNECDFVKYLHGRKVRYLHPLFTMCFNEIYGTINRNSIVYCWRNRSKQKYDIFISISGTVKRASIKMGSKNSVHIEPISEFVHFLIKNGVDGRIISEYLRYHYTDGTTNGRGLERQSVAEYKQNNQSKIDEINVAINTPSIIKEATTRFVLKGRNSKEEIDLLIYGTIYDFLWITKEDIIEIISRKANTYSTGVHFANLSCQPMGRCLNRNPLYEKNRFCVQIKWFNLFDEILEHLYIKQAIKSRRDPYGLL